MGDYWLVEKSNRHALHGIFATRERAERHLAETIPEYVAKRYFMDKTLTPDDFEVIQAPERRTKR